MMQDSVRLYQHVFQHPKVQAAWHLAAECHSSDLYGTHAYINHLHEVAELIFWNYPHREQLYINGRVRHSDELDRLIDEISAGFLHDVLEDHPDRVSYQDIKDEFGHRVARIVRLASDIDVKKEMVTRNAENWRERKQWYLDRLAAKAEHLHDPDIISYLRVACADKYANTQATLHHHREKLLMGNEGHFWQSFKAHKEDRLWYDNALASIFEGLLSACSDEVKPQIQGLVEGLVRVTEAINMRAQYLPENLQTVVENQAGKPLLAAA